jgi:hypothetical protein
MPSSDRYSPDNPFYWAEYELYKLRGHATPEEMAPIFAQLAALAAKYKSAIDAGFEAAQRQRRAAIARPPKIVQDLIAGRCRPKLPWHAPIIRDITAEYYAVAFNRRGL